MTTETSESTPQIQDVVSAVTSPQDVVPAPKPEAAPSPPEITEDMIASYLAGKTHDDLKRIPAYNQQVQRAIQRERQDLTRQQQEEQQRLAENQRADAYFQSLKPEEILRARDTNPQFDDQYRRVQAWKQNRSGADRETWAGQAIETIRQHLEAHDELNFLTEKAAWDELQQSKSLGEFINNVVEKGYTKKMEKFEKDAKKLVDAAVEAKINERLAALNENASAPQPPAGGVAGSGGALTLEQYNAMSRTERRNLPASEVDRMARIAQGLERG